MFMDARKPPRDIAGYDPVVTAGDCMYDEEAAEKAVQFFPRLMRHIKGPNAGEPFRLEEWQANVNRTIFGWKRPDGTRRYRVVFIAVPRKNGKSTWMAGNSNYVLFTDAEGGAECYCAASDREQASLVFNLAASMVRKQPGLDKACKIRDSQKRIVYGDSFLRAIPANEGGSHGFNSHYINGDELHAWPGRDFYDVLHTSTGARGQPLETYITTAGYDRNSICYEVYQYAKQIRDGKIDDPSFLPVIYEAEEADDWTDPEVWAKANPNLGVSVSLEYLASECAKAKANPAYENTFRRLHLNQWTSQESRWLQMDKWRKCPGTKGEIEESAVVFGGLDLSSNVDVTAWALAQKLDDGYRLQCHYFIPEGRMREAEKRDRVPYSQWAIAGWVTPTPGDAIDYAYVHRRIVQDSERYNIGAVGYDPWNAEPTRIHLENEGLTMVQMRQGVKTLSTPCKELERCVIEGKLDHSGDPVLEWMAENVQVKTDDSGNIKPVKPAHGGSAKRIDGIVAAVMAINAAQLTEIPQASIYETPGMLTL